MARTLTGERLEKELLRLETMKAYEKENKDCALICGIDEAGRGPLAGPVAAGAVILPRDCHHPVSQRFKEAVGKAAGGAVPGDKGKGPGLECGGGLPGQDR